jgi:glucose/arabinose dehydrogenase
MIMKAFTVALGVLIAAIAQAETNPPFKVEPIAKFDEPWALALLPDGRMLVTEKKGNLLIVTQQGEVSGKVGGVPDVDYGGQGGLGDVALHPQFSENRLIYLSFAEGGPGGTRGAAVVRAALDESEEDATLSNVEVIWRQYPKMLGYGHYGHRLLFDKEGFLWISSGDRQKFTPAQDMQTNLGKILRLHDDGSIPKDNPFVDYLSRDAFADDVGVYGQIWSLGHRNPLGIAFDVEGRLWAVEMGPEGGDEMNLIKRAANYGYPIVSDGDHYDGRAIPDHKTRPEYEEPAITWTPVISPGNLTFYRGNLFPDWRGDAFIAGLSAKAILRIKLDGERAQEIERYDMGVRIRTVVEGPDGALWVLEDERNASGGRLLKLTPNGRP